MSSWWCQKSRSMACSFLWVGHCIQPQTSAAPGYVRHPQTAVHHTKFLMESAGKLVAARMNTRSSTQSPRAPASTPVTCIIDGRSGTNSIVQSHSVNQLQAVSGDDSGAICVWDTTTGMRDGHFTNLHGNAKLTAMTFDASGRRLLTASDTGEVSMWNFTNGSRLRRFTHTGPKLEFTCLLYICDEARQLPQVAYLLRDVCCRLGASNFCRNR